MNKHTPMRPATSPTADPLDRNVNVRKTLAELSRKRRTLGSAALAPVPDEMKEVEMSLAALRIDEETAFLLDSQIIKVGKFRGRTFAYAARDHFYCKWVLGIPYASGALGRFKAYLVENRERLIAQQMAEALAAEGTLSQRVRVWNRDNFLDRGLLTPAPVLSNCTFHGSRRPRQPVASLQTAGVLDEWSSKWTKVEKRRAKTQLSLCGRTLNYLFRWLVHAVRREPVTERLVADKALRVLGENQYAYETALRLAGGDPDGLVSGEALQAELARRRAALNSDAKRARLPTEFDLSRLGEDLTRIKPRAILLRYMLSLRELRAALKAYRDVSTDAMSARWAPLIRACWTLARADGAFSWNRVSNAECPERLTDPCLRVVQFMRRVVARHFAKASAVNYAPCVGFEGAGGCPVEADLVVGDTVFAVRGGLWVSSGYDCAYLSAYAALARRYGAMPVQHVSVVYLQHESMLTLDLHDWDHEPLLAFLTANGGTELQVEGGNACDLGLCEQDDFVPVALDEDPEEKERSKHVKRAARRVQQQGQAAGVRRVYVPSSKPTKGRTKER